MTPDLDHITSPEYLADLANRTLSEVRHMRSTCQHHENATSFVRRVAQGRLDIVGGELSRRRAGGDPTDLGELIGRLPDILAEHPTAGTLSRPPLDLEPDPALVAPLAVKLDVIVEASHLASIDQRSDEELKRIADALQQFEGAVSQQRRMLHDQIDRLQSEITRRYRDGEASVETLLE